MNVRNLLIPLGLLILLWAAYQNYQWMGVLAVSGGIMMWLLLHFNRTMQVLRRAADRPVGYVDSAVMLNAKLRPGVNLLHIVAMTRSIGDLVSPKDTQPELYRWTDNSQSHVTCELNNGKLVSWKLERPVVAADDGPAAPAAANTAAKAPASH